MGEVPAANDGRLRCRHGGPVHDETCFPVTEYAVMMSGGGMHVRNGDPEIEEIYPLAQWIPGQRRFGRKVYRRRIFVVEDWEEVTGP